MKFKSINIYGASGHAKVVIDIITSNDNINVGHVFDDNDKLKSISNYTIQSPSNSELMIKYPIVIAIGNNKIRKKIGFFLIFLFVCFLFLFFKITAIPISA